MVKRGERAFVVPKERVDACALPWAAMAYAIENARFQWEEGERRLRQADEVDAAATWSARV